jgi:uncharacterized protein YqgV (UPF0045/DUF77 family)
MIEGLKELLEERDMVVSVQFSVYPLRDTHLSRAIEKAVKILRDSKLPVEMGSMSSVTYGNSGTVFKAFQKIYDELASDAHIVITMTISNACPVPIKTEENRNEQDENP